MKITVINGQNHKGATYNMGKMLAKKLSDDITEFYLPRDFGEFCCGCTNCFGKSETLCPHYEKLRSITEAMDSADVLIFTTPVYVFHCSGPMKAFLDHYGYRWMVHRPEEKMFKKQAVVLSTAAGAGMKSANRDIEHSMFFWGVGRIYSCGVAVMETSWERVGEKKKAKISKKLDKIAKKIENRHGRVNPSVKTKCFFSIMSKFHKKGCFPSDDVYWREKGWCGNIRPWKK
ncbi:MAG: flavodoxin family protein [Porcipelethomonas sp.]